MLSWAPSPLNISSTSSFVGWVLGFLGGKNSNTFLLPQTSSPKHYMYPKLETIGPIPYTLNITPLLTALCMLRRAKVLLQPSVTSIIWGMCVLHIPRILMLQQPKHTHTQIRSRRTNRNTKTGIEPHTNKRTYTHTQTDTRTHTHTRAHAHTQAPAHPPTHPPS